MSKLIKVDVAVYDRLDQIRGRGETFGQVIGNLLDARDGLFDLLNVIEGSLKFRDWQRRRLEEAAAADQLPGQVLQEV